MPKPNPLADMVEIVLPKPEAFLIIKETLTRIGIPNKDGDKLYQTCHILCKRKRYFLVSFKEMFKLDNKPTNLTVSDIARRNSIINYLLERGFFTLMNGETKVEPHLPHTGKNDDFTIIQHTDKKNWKLIPKYVIGNPANKKSRKKPVAKKKVAIEIATSTAQVGSQEDEMLTRCDPVVA